LLENAYLKFRYEQEYPASEKDLSMLFDKGESLAGSDGTYCV